MSPTLADHDPESAANPCRWNPKWSQPKDCKHCSLTEFCPQLHDYIKKHGLTGARAVTPVYELEKAQELLDQITGTKEQQSIGTNRQQPKDRRIRLNDEEILMIWKALTFWNHISGEHIQPYGLWARFHSLSHPEEGYIARRSRW